MLAELVLSALILPAVPIQGIEPPIPPAPGLHALAPPHACAPAAAGMPDHDAAPADARALTGAGTPDRAFVPVHACAPDHGPRSDGTDDATTEIAFPEAERWARLFDRPERVAWQMPAEVVRALGLKEGMNVADIGAGTGYFNRFLSEAVGPVGKVYAVDIEPDMIDHMKERAQQEGTPNVIPTLAEPEDPGLPKGSIDVVMIVNTYHHIDDRLRYFARLGEPLRPGGRIAVIDFLKKRIPVGPPADHKLSREHVIGEMESAGYRLVEQPGFLPYQYFLIFRIR